MSCLRLRCRPSLHSRMSAHTATPSPAAFVPLVRRCAAADPLAVRQLAAKALAPLLAPAEVPGAIVDLAAAVADAIAGGTSTQGASQQQHSSGGGRLAAEGTRPPANAVHGWLLQLGQLLEGAIGSDDVAAAELAPGLAEVAAHLRWVSDAVAGMPRLLAMSLSRQLECSALVSVSQAGGNVLLMAGGCLLLRCQPCFVPCAVPLRTCRAWHAACCKGACCMLRGCHLHAARLPSACCKAAGLHSARLQGCRLHSVRLQAAFCEAARLQAAYCKAAFCEAACLCRPSDAECMDVFQGVLCRRCVGVCALGRYGCAPLSLEYLRVAKALAVLSSQQGHAAAGQAQQAQQAQRDLLRSVGQHCWAAITRLVALQAGCARNPNNCTRL